VAFPPSFANAIIEDTFLNQESGLACGLFFYILISFKLAFFKAIFNAAQSTNI
jgi:hypothetical protein